MTTLSVLMVEPGKKPAVAEIDNDLKTFEEMVNGPVDVLPFFRSPFKMVCSMEAGYNLTHGKKKPGDTFFIVKYDGSDFEGLELSEADELRDALKLKMKKWK